MAGEAANVPELRFPGFEGEWERTTLSSFFPKIRNGFVGTATPYYVESGIPYLQGKNIKRGRIDAKGLIEVSEFFHSRQHKTQLESDDILMVQSGHVGDCAVVGEKFSGGNCHALVVMSPTLNAHSAFFISYFYSKSGQRQIHRITTGNTVQHILTSDLKPLIIASPSLPEQQKIAAFLGAVDGKIGQLEKKKELLEDYKKGCMQKLFSRTLRFKDDNGNDFPDWEERRLGDVFEWVRTNSLSREHLTYGNGTVQNIHYGDIHTKFSANFRQSGESVPFLAPSANLKLSSGDYCKLGDVVIADASEDHSDIGKAIEIVELSGIPLVAGLHTYIARPRNDDLRIGFSGYLLRSPDVRLLIMRIAQGISVLGISKKELEKLILAIPHPAEQQKIANFLTAIDDKITLTTNQLTQAQTFKKGLLQQMFV